MNHQLPHRRPTRQPRLQCLQKRALLLLSTLALAATASAEPNFSGTWTLNASKSDYGQFPAPILMVRTVSYRDGLLKMSTLQSGVQGEVRSELAYTTDGKPSINGENRGTASWQGATLIIDVTRTVQDAQLTSRESWSLSTDGSVLTIDSRINLPGQGAFDIKQVFEKAPSL